jgi:hypothetical protein
MPARTIALVTLAFGLGLFAFGAQANVFVEDRRQQRDPTLPLFRSVGVLHHADTGAGGTAFLVGPCHVLTAFHVAFMRSRDPATARVEVSPARVGRTADFLIGLDPNLPGRFKVRTPARVVAFGAYSDADYAGMAGDWAILRLDRCLGATYGYLKLGPARDDDVLPEGELMTIGFPRSRGQSAGVTVERGCRAQDHGPAPGLIGVDCAFENGMSGGPVLERSGNLGWRVMGIVQQSLGAVDSILPAYSMAHRNQVVAATAFRQALDQALRAPAKRALATKSR